MAVISDAQLAEVRRQVAKKLDGVVDFGKPEINAAVQAVEDWLVAEKVTIAGLINAATNDAGATPPTSYTFTSAQKKIIVAYVLAQRAVRELQ